MGIVGIPRDECNDVKDEASPIIVNLEWNRKKCWVIIGFFDILFHLMYAICGACVDTTARYPSLTTVLFINFSDFF